MLLAALSVVVSYVIWLNAQKKTQGRLNSRAVRYWVIMSCIVSLAHREDIKLRYIAGLGV